MLDHALIEWFKEGNHRQRFDLSATNERLQIIVEHSLVGHVYPSLEASHPFKSVLESVFYAYLKQAEQHDHLKQRFETLFAQRGCQIRWLKGAHYKTLYPHSYQRPMGDLDFFLPKTSRTQVAELMVEDGWKLYAKNQYHWTYQHRQNPRLLAEWHFALMPEGLYSTTHPLYHPETYLLTFNSLTSSFTLLYHFAHAAKHFKAGGFGLLTLLDLVKLDQKYQAEFDVPWLIKALKDANLYRFASGLIQLTHTYLAPTLSLKASFTDAFLDEEEAQLFMEIILVSGQNAKARHHQPLALQRAGTAKRPHTFVLNKWILPKTHMQSMYPRLMRVPVIGVVIAYVFRFFKLMWRFKTPSKLSQAMVLETLNTEKVQHLMQTLLSERKE